MNQKLLLSVNVEPECVPMCWIHHSQFLWRLKLALCMFHEFFGRIKLSRIIFHTAHKRRIFVNAFWDYTLADTSDCMLYHFCARCGYRFFVTVWNLLLLIFSWLAHRPVYLHSVRVSCAVGRLHVVWTILPNGKNIIYGCLRCGAEGNVWTEKRCGTAELKTIAFVISAARLILPHCDLFYIAGYFSVFHWPFIFRFLDKIFEFLQIANASTRIRHKELCSSSINRCNTRAYPNPRTE